MKGYKDMLQQTLRELLLVSLESRPFLICVCSADLDTAMCNNIKKAVAEYQYAYEKISYVEVPRGVFTKGQLGCMSHPNAKGQRLMAELLYPEVKRILKGSESLE